MAATALAGSARMATGETPWRAVRPGLRVLIAEDEPLAAMVIEEALTEAGYSVLLAANGEEALSLATGEVFDILLTDLAMPRMTGWELIPRLRAQQSGLPVVVMTGFLPPGGSEVLRAGSQGPLTILQKPLRIDQLIEALERTVAATPRLLAYA